MCLNDLQQQVISITLFRLMNLLFLLNVMFRGSTEAWRCGLWQDQRLWTDIRGGKAALAPRRANVEHHQHMAQDRDPRKRQGWAANWRPINGWQRAGSDSDWPYWRVSFAEATNKSAGEGQRFDLSAAVPVDTGSRWEPGKARRTAGGLSRAWLVVILYRLIRPRCWYLSGPDYRWRSEPSGWRQPSWELRASPVTWAGSLTLGDIQSLINMSGRGGSFIIRIRIIIVVAGYLCLFKLSRLSRSLYWV